MAFMARGNDVEMERKVSTAARNLGDGVQQIVVAAKNRGGSEWKIELLELLGRSDLQILLENSKCNKFVLRCVENELPPNLIHCLRLLRVLELQHVAAKQQQQQQEEKTDDKDEAKEKEESKDDDDDNKTDESQEETTDDASAAQDDASATQDEDDTSQASATPQDKEEESLAQEQATHEASVQATEKVSQLLCLLCKDQSVGEQLRPHLFGLLALSGASYPLSGVHVAKAASDVICAFSQHCLSNNLVWFLHDRKMIVHMTDDIKELCGITEVTSSASSLCLYGAAAEKAGLWVIAIKTVVNLVTYSCNHNCVELLKDFDKASGYSVLYHAVKNAGPENTKKLLELVTMLACCRTRVTKNPFVGGKKEDKRDARLVTNPLAFDIVQDLMKENIPLLKEYEQVYSGERPKIEEEESWRELATFSMRTALNVRFGGDDDEPKDVDEFGVSTELLVTTLQLYSDHPGNYAIIEDRYRILSLYLMAFPTFEDDSLKTLILKTLEYVFTGVAGPDALKPLKIASEIFFALCKSLLKAASTVETDSEEDAIVYEKLLQDADMVCGTFEKLLEFDNRVGQVLMDGGILTTKLNDILDLVTQATEADIAEDEDTFEVNGKIFRQPPASTPLDRVFATVCRVLRLVVAEQSGSSEPRDSLANELEDTSAPMTSNLNSLLLTAVNHLGDDASVAALRVFETKMISHTSSELVMMDMEFIMELLGHFAEMTGRLNGLSVFKRSDERDTIDIGERTLNANTILREARVCKTLKDVMERSPLAQEAFRINGGFETIIRATLCLDGIVPDEDLDDISDDEELEACASSVIRLLEWSFGLLSAATLPQSRQNSAPVHTSTLATGDTFTEESVSSPAACNRHYLRQRGFFINYANAIASTGILCSARYATQTLNLTLAYMDPSLSLRTKEERQRDEEAGKKVQYLRNPDASRLLLGIATCLPLTEMGILLSKRALEEMLRLCAPDMIGTTLSQIAACGLCWGITNSKEFAPILEDRTHHLYSRFVLLLRRIAAFSMSYMDFVSLLRCVAGPMLKVDSKDNRIRLPVVSSSVRTNTTVRRRGKSTSDVEAWEEEEADFCIRLETLSVIAERGDRVARCELGGDSLDTVSKFKQQAKIEDIFSAMAENGLLKFIQIESLDSMASTPAGLANAGTPSPFSSTAERIWTPLASSGFSYAAWIRLTQPIGNESGNVFVLDLSGPYDSRAESPIEFMSLWYNVEQQCFSVLSSTIPKSEPFSFPPSPLRHGVWHHIVVTYVPTKRSVMSRKAALGVFVDGRPLDGEARFDSISLPPNAWVHIGVPNPYLAMSGIVKGSLPLWELGTTLMLSMIVSKLDATAIFMHGPDFSGVFWGDRPQRLSIAATGTAAFAMLAESGEQGSVAGALRRREIHRLEGAGTVNRRGGSGPNQRPGSDSLSILGLLFTVPPDNLLFAFRAASSTSSAAGSKAHYSRRMMNIARINSSNESVSIDAVVYGIGSVVSPHCFADNVQWVGGPSVLVPIVNAARSTRTMALALRLIRESVHRHPPNLEMLQAGGGYRMLAVLLRQKKIMDASVLDQCFAFAVHGFMPHMIEDHEINMMNSSMASTLGAPLTWPNSERWVFTDLDALKYLLLNHQVWDMRNSGPDLPLRLLSFLNGLVAQDSAQKAFNSRRLHMLGIVQWTLHLMMEAAELFTLGEIGAAQREQKRTNDSPTGPLHANASAAINNGWYHQAPSVASTSVGGDPDNAVLQGCKTLLRRVLTFMLTPSDLEAIAEATVYTIAITTNGKVGGSGGQKQAMKTRNDGVSPDDSKLMPGAVARVYLLRLIEELVVDGVNEIVASVMEKKSKDDEIVTEPPAVQAHIGGGASTNQSYLTTSMMRGRSDDKNPEHQKAQAFLSAFAGVLTPVWFACLLEGCHEEASASAVLRLMTLMLQSSPMFTDAFEAAGGFAPLVLSIPKYSTCPSIIMSMLSQLLQAHILHLPCFGVLDADQLCEIFDAENGAESIARTRNQGRRPPSDPSCGIFALLAECLGRNIQLAPFDNAIGLKARQTNEAVLRLLSHQHRVSKAFRDFCRTPDFLEPLAQALCLVYDERLQRIQQNAQGDDTMETSDTFRPDLQQGGDKGTRRGNLCTVPKNQTPTERFVGSPDDETGISGIGMVKLLHLVLQHAVMSGPFAAPLVSALFRSFPIHASPEQVEAFHLVLIEHCQQVVKIAQGSGEPIALANCIGVSSVILDRLMAGFFTSEPVLEAVKMITSTLKCITTKGSDTSYSLGSAEEALLTADAAHLARLTCITALQRSQPMGPNNEGDEDLKVAVLDAVSANIVSLLIVPTSGQSTPKKPTKGGTMNSAFPTPPPGSRTYLLWKSTSLARSSVEVTYEDLSVADEPDKSFVIALMDQIHPVLLDTSNEDLREQVVSIVVTLLQMRRAVMSDILIAEVSRGDKKETIDIMNRGGFGALLVAHEAARVAGNFSIVPQRSNSRSSSGGSKSKYGSFYEWLDGNKSKVETVFHDIHIQATELFPTSETGAPTPEDAIENEQKSMLLRLTSQDSSDRTILGGLERAELGQRCYDKTSATHLLWKRQGFDDLSSGAMQWKVLLRQLKGSCSIWEKGSSKDEKKDEQPFFSPNVLLRSMTCDDRDGLPKMTSEEKLVEKDDVAAVEVVTRWKLDLTEGYERQRRRLLPNYEFHTLYNLDELADHASPVPEGEDEGSGNVLNTSFAPPQSLEATTALLKDLHLKKANRQPDEEYDDDVEGDDENATAPTAATSEGSLTDSEVDKQSPESSTSKVSSKRKLTGQKSIRTMHIPGADDSMLVSEPEEAVRDNVNASSYDLITGLLKAGDWPERSYNVMRCTGLEVRKALLLWCNEAIYIIDGFEQTDGEGLEGRIKRVEKEQSTFSVSLRTQNASAGSQGALNADDKGGTQSKSKEQNASDEITYQHRSQRLSFADLYSVFRRRYELQQVALEFYDIHRSGTLVAFNNHAEREEVLMNLLSSPLPNSIFNASGLSINYKKFMNTWKTKIITQWQTWKNDEFRLSDAFELIRGTILQ